MNLKRALVIRLAASVVLTLAAVPLFHPPVSDMSVAPAVPRPVTPFAAQVLISEHECWTGPAPAGVRLPGHVVVTTASGHLKYSVRLVGPALEHVFHGKHPRLVVHAFCK